VNRLAELAAGGPALELAVGTGRVAIPLAERGVDVSGIELSRHMIARLREKSDLPVVHGDMATATAPRAGEYSLVYLVFNTISNLLEQHQQVACFRNAARHLRPGGAFVVENGVPALPAGSPGAVFAYRDGYIGLDIVEPATQRLVSYHFSFGDFGTEDAILFRSPHRYVWPAELDLMAELAGLTPESRHADWSGTPFTDTSASHITTYRRPTASRP
jgi:SAM-dependent methyltransferase